MNHRPPYEPDTVDAGRLLLPGLFFALGLTLILGAMYLLWRPTRTLSSRAHALPPAPRLQQQPWRDLQAATMAQRQRLESYGWNDPQHRFAHIPLQRAMEWVASDPSLVRRAGR